MLHAVRVAVLPLVLATSLAHAATTGPARKPQPDTLRGEVVDLGGYLVDRERIGEEYAARAREAIAAGLPVGILTSDGTLYLALGKDFKIGRAHV